jgi:urease accessory protein
VTSQTWNARLALDYRHDRGRTLLARSHTGPLVVQKALYPEGPQLCHTLVVHPPGGIAGGDALTIEARVGPEAQALVTTPGATKWYKANGRIASQSVDMRIDGQFEWLPQETIVFDKAQVRSSITIALGERARTIGWDIVALGRAASGETFDDGAFAQTIRLSDANDGGRLQWVERTRIAGGDALLASPIGLAGHHVFGCLWAGGLAWSDSDLDTLRERLPPAAAPVTRVAPRLLLARVLASSTPAARHALQAVWAAVRPLVFGRPALAPRIWAT